MAKFSDSIPGSFAAFPSSIRMRFFANGRARKVWATEEERQRAWWLWRRRPREMNVFLYGLLLGIGAMAHTPFLILGSLQLFCVFHAGYILFVLWVVGMFFAKDARYRRWKKDYLRAIARLAR